MRFDEMPGPMQKMIQTQLPVQIDDVLTLDQSNAIVRAGANLGTIRIVLYVPMVKESELIGAFILSRQEVRPFTEKAIELVKNFAAQARANLPVERCVFEDRVQPCAKLRALLKPPPLVRWVQGDFAALRKKPARPCAVHQND